MSTAAINTKPILFNPDMVRAILEGQKTVTRRAVKPAHGGVLEIHDDLGGVPRLCEKCGVLCRGLKPPYQLGDIMYVREAWFQHYDGTYDHRAGHKFEKEGGWRPSIHMPKEAARIFLRVTDVRVERLQDCGKGWCIDIEREGICTPQDPILYISDDAYHDALKAEMEKVWDSTIKPADRALYGWGANPWVWVIGFERINREETT